MSISYWLTHKDSFNSSAASSSHYDFIIVGAGIAGLSTAYWLLQENPNSKIAILERNTVGFGASGRNAGFVTCGSTEHFIKLYEQFGLQKASEIWKFSEDNRRLLLEHIVQDQTDLVDYRHTGSCTVAPSSAHWSKYKKTADLMKVCGIDVHEVDPQNLEADYGVTGFEGGIQYTGDGYIHPIKLLQLLRSKIKVDIFEHTEVLKIESAGDEKVHTSAGVFTADKIIFTVNAYLPLLLNNFSDVIKPGRGQILVTEPLPAFVKGPCYLTKHLCYFRQLPTGHLLVGGFRNLDLDKENTHEDQITNLIQTAIFDFIKSHFKFGPQAKIAYQWSGIMGFTPDGQMMIGSLPENKNIHVMAGCSGHGMGLSFNAAHTLVKSLHGIPVPEHLSLGRFFLKS
ncbi:NAD(P)/FAD-dependent oxidoreductase [Bdellovibrio reynosensis]|uniref:FAD-binding oxidoreductase n=1 Tax=Bdellovibrio reynosensis TaxID=2835041 RepID=A0ABY4CAY7_9BACT|nr:FAD-binding oxidoreductase [Bdellovibrio reynosensis]UOF02136.1 FAD-binding oxidoreductase [Bdellovibrio reynosensis]